MKPFALVFLLFSGVLFAQDDYLKVNHNRSLTAGQAMFVKGDTPVRKTVASMERSGLRSCEPITRYEL